MATDLDTTARMAALRRLAEAHEKFAEREQIYVAEGRDAEAEDARQYIRWIRRALDVEMQDPPVGHKA